MQSVFADFGCTATVQRATVMNATDKQPTRTYADDPGWTNVNATTLDAEAASKAKVYGLVEGSTLMILVPRKTSGLLQISTLDRIRITSGPYNGRTFQADAPGIPSLVATAISVSEV